MYLEKLGNIDVIKIKHIIDPYPFMIMAFFTVTIAIHFPSPYTFSFNIYVFVVYLICMHLCICKNLAGTNPLVSVFSGAPDYNFP